MKVAALEIPARFDRASENLALVDALLSRGPCDLALLPEASLTGYVSPRGDFDLTRFAEPKDGPTSRALAELARKHRTHLVGPLVERDDRGLYNAMIGFDPEGREWLHYRKRHPWYPETWATPGTEIAPIVRIQTFSVTIAVCFDVHFAEWPRADVLLFPSAWAEDRADSRLHLLTKLGARGGQPLERDHQREPQGARASARQRPSARMHVVNANWGVGEPRVPGQGDSCILHASGAVLAKGGPRIDAEIA